MATKHDKGGIAAKKMKFKGKAGFKKGLKPTVKGSKGAKRRSSS